MDSVNPDPATSPSRLIIAAVSQAYESDDGGVTVFPLPTADTSGAYTVEAGGVSGGVANANVTYIGYKDNQVYVRTGPGTTFFRTGFGAAAGPSGNEIPAQIVTDPNNWHTVFVVTPTDVWMGTDVQQPGQTETWTRITSDLDTLIGHNNPLLNSMAVIDQSNTTIVLVGGLNGLYRTINPGVNATWAKAVGNGFPDAPVYALHYDAQNDVLVAGTLGRGIWEVRRASVELGPGNPNVATVSADDASASSNTIVLQADSSKSSVLDAFINNASTPNLTIDTSVVHQINLGAVGSDTQLTLDAGSFTGETVAPQGVGNGSIQLDNLTISLSNLFVIDDATTAAHFQFNDAQIDGDLSLSNGPTIAGAQTSVRLQSDGRNAFIALNLAHKAAMTLAANGDSTVELVATATPDGLTGLTVDQPGNCTVNVEATTVPTTIVGGGGGESVIVGNNHSVQGILGAVTVEDHAALTSLTVDAGNDSPAAGVVVFNANLALNTGSITGLAPAAINFLPNEMYGLTVDGFNGAATYHVLNTGSNGYTTFLDLARGSNTVAIVGSSGPVTINAAQGGNEFLAGDGTVQAIGGPLAFNAAAGSSTNALAVQDANDISGRSATLSTTAITGLAPGTITYGSANLGSGGFFVDLGTGTNTLTVTDTPAAPTAIYGGGGSGTTSTITVDATNASNLLTIYMQNAARNVVNVVSSQGKTYDLAVHGGENANTLSVTDPIKSPEITIEPSGTNQGKVQVSYFLRDEIIGGHVIPIFQTYFVPYTGFQTVTGLPDPEKSLIQGVFHLALARSATAAELDTWDAALKKDGIRAIVKKIEHLPGVLKPKQRPAIVLKDLPDFAVVQAELKVQGHKSKRPERKGVVRTVDLGATALTPGEGRFGTGEPGPRAAGIPS